MANACFGLMFSRVFAGVFVFAVIGTLEQYTVPEATAAAVRPVVIVVPFLLWAVYLSGRPKSGWNIAGWSAAAVGCTALLILVAGWLGWLVVFILTPVLVSEAIRLGTVAVRRRRQFTRQNTLAEDSL